MELRDYFNPVDFSQFKAGKRPNERGRIGSWITLLNELRVNDKIADFELALIGVTDNRNSAHPGVDAAPDKIRDEFYRLARFDEKLRVIDLGNVINGKTVKDTYFAIAEVCAYLYENSVLPIILGGGQDVTWAMIKALDSDKKSTNLVTVDPKIDTPFDPDLFDAENYLEKIVNDLGKGIWNISCLAHQTYNTEPEKLAWLSKKNFDEVRLGEMRGDITLAEPYFRDADVVSVDISSIRQCDAPAHPMVRPNGMYAEEACRISRYAGISDRMKLFGIFGVVPELDIREQTSILAAQIMWHFIDGFQHRTGDYPAGSLDEYTSYHVELEDIDFPLVFYKSPRSNRWWVEVSWTEQKSEKKVVACSKKDYEMACKNEVPETWWKSYRKNN